MQEVSWVFGFLKQAFHLSTFLGNLLMQTETHVTFANTACTGVYHVCQRILVVPICFPGYAFNDPPNPNYFLFYWFWSPVERVSTGSVISDHQDSVVGHFAGAVVLNDSTKVVLPAHSIHNHSQGTVLHQVTHHGLFLTAKGGQQDSLVLTQQKLAVCISHFIVILACKMYH